LEVVKELLKHQPENESRLRATETGFIVSGLLFAKVYRYRWPAPSWPGWNTANLGDFWTDTSENFLSKIVGPGNGAR
jgi:hypothetical protein